MKQRSPIAVFFLSLITVGIYAIVWEVKTKNEMNKLGAEIPTAWLLIIPFANIYWTWKYSEGVEKVTQGKISGILAFILLFLLGIIGMAIIQDTFNKVAPADAMSGQGTDSVFPPPTAASAQIQPAINPSVTPTQPSPPPPANANFGGPLPTPTVSPPSAGPEVSNAPTEPPEPGQPNPPQIQ